MSAYIVDDTTINRILAGIKVARLDHEVQYPRPLGLLEAEALPDLGQQLFMLNCEAIRRRYDEDQVEGFIGQDGYIFAQVNRPTRVQLLKSLRCFLYQCSEGTIPEVCDLFKDLQTFSDGLAYYIVSNLPEYEKAEWK
jgi:hypothetical protein